MCVFSKPIMSSSCVQSVGTSSIDAHGLRRRVVTPQTAVHAFHTGSLFTRRHVLRCGLHAEDVVGEWARLLKLSSTRVGWYHRLYGTGTGNWRPRMWWPGCRICWKFRFLRILLSALCFSPGLAIHRKSSKSWLRLFRRPTTSKNWTSITKLAAQI